MTKTVWVVNIESWYEGPDGIALTGSVDNYVFSTKRKADAFSARREKLDLWEGVYSPEKIVIDKEEQS